MDNYNYLSVKFLFFFLSLYNHIIKVLNCCDLQYTMRKSVVDFFVFLQIKIFIRDISAHLYYIL